MLRVLLLLSVVLFAVVPTAADQPADVVFLGGNVVTSDTLRPEVEALAIRSGRIVAVGDIEEVLAFKGPDTEVVDLNGRAVLPGFIEAHTHPIFREWTRHTVDVSPRVHGDLESILSTLREAAAKGPVLAFGFDPSLLAGEPTLNFEKLDAISTEVPIVVVNLSCPIGYGNRLAFQLAGITEDTPDPMGGSLEKDELSLGEGRGGLLVALFELGGSLRPGGLDGGCLRGVLLGFALAGSSDSAPARGQCSVRDLALPEFVGLPFGVPQSVMHGPHLRDG